MNRIDRLTAILIHLQTKKVVKAQELADRFSISLRTVYRDIRSLEEAGVPIGAEAGIGYFLEGYNLPPVMFTNAEASALLVGGKFVEKLADKSLTEPFQSALYKIKAVMKGSEKEYLEELEPKIAIHSLTRPTPYSDHLLNEIQEAIAQQQVLSIEYLSNYNEQITQREVEAIGLYHYGRGWHLIGFCTLRQDYRDFRVDRIRQLTNTGKRFTSRRLLSLQQYLSREVEAMPQTDVTLVFRKNVVRFMQEQKYVYGYESEESLGDTVRMHFKTRFLEGLSRWILMFGDDVSVESPESLKTLMRSLAAEIRDHYLPEIS
ncbi:hypothetical protein GCM10023189_52410 [Nibrella saemangeumensis]|uniref:HTH deoR-type domain-containing protein n=1 Tax=Nibrella saemangeumensis TaxID=1084526 RepID=A0ABP8NIK1_9BACT